MQSAQAAAPVAADQTRNHVATGGGSEARDARQAVEEDKFLSTGDDPGTLLPASAAKPSPRSVELQIEELVTANRCKDEFLAVLCHELNTPLASIQNAVGVLRGQGGVNEAQHGMHALIERQVRHMTLLIADLLDTSRITSGHVRLRPERVDLCAVARHAIETVEWDFKQRKHRITATLSNSPVWLHADARRLEQVLVNLLINGSKYTDAGGELALSVYVRDSIAVMRVRDCGIGIAPEMLPHIFDLFVQSDEAVARCRDGLGVGLALVRSIVELHGGSVSAASAGLGQGSEFTVCLPAQT